MKETFMSEKGKKFNLKNYQKINGDEHIDMRLDALRGDIPDVINEKQLEKYRPGEAEGLTELQLKKNRPGAETEITEKRLDTHKSKFANKYRNPEAHTGDMNKLEEQRLNNDPVEKEKYEAASSTPKQFKWWEEKSPDGLKLSENKQNIKIAKGKEKKNKDEMTFDKPRWQDLKEEEGAEEEIKANENNAIDPLIKEKPLGIELSRDSQRMKITKQKDFPNADTSMVAIYMQLSYDPNDFGGDENRIKQAAMEKIEIARPILFNQISADDLAIKESDMEGTVSLRLIGKEASMVLGQEKKPLESPVQKTNSPQSTGGKYKEISYDEKDDGSGTNIAIGRVLVNPTIDITEENQENIIIDALAFINKNHPNLNVDRDSLDLSAMTEYNKIGFMVGVPSEIESMESPITENPESSEPLDAFPITEEKEELGEVNEVNEETTQASSDYDIIVTSDTKKK